MRDCAPLRAAACEPIPLICLRRLCPLLLPVRLKKRLSPRCARERECSGDMTKLTPKKSRNEEKPSTAQGDHEIVECQRLVCLSLKVRFGSDGAFDRQLGDENGQVGLRVNEDKRRAKVS